MFSQALTYADTELRTMENVLKKSIVNCDLGVDIKQITTKLEEIKKDVLGPFENMSKFANTYENGQVQACVFVYDSVQACLKRYVQLQAMKRDADRFNHILPTLQTMADAVSEEILDELLEEQLHDDLCDFLKKEKLWEQKAAWIENWGDTHDSWTDWGEPVETTTIESKVETLEPNVGESPKPDPEPVVESGLFDKLKESGLKELTGWFSERKNSLTASAMADLEHDPKYATITNMSKSLAKELSSTFGEAPDVTDVNQLSKVFGFVQKAVDTLNVVDADRLATEAKDYMNHLKELVGESALDAFGFAKTENQVPKAESEKDVVAEKCDSCTCGVEEKFFSETDDSESDNDCTCSSCHKHISSDSDSESSVSSTLSEENDCKCEYCLKFHPFSSRVSDVSSDSSDSASENSYDELVCNCELCERSDSESENSFESDSDDLPDLDDDLPDLVERNELKAPFDFQEKVLEIINLLDSKTPFDEETSPGLQDESDDDLPTLECCYCGSQEKCDCALSRVKNEVTQALDECFGTLEHEKKIEFLKNIYEKVCTKLEQTGTESEDSIEALGSERDIITNVEYM